MSESSEALYDRSEDIIGAAYTSIGPAALRVAPIGRYAMPFKPYVWGAVSANSSKVAVRGGRARFDRSGEI